MNGSSFVSTMSKDAQDLYLNAAVFWAVQGNMSAYNSEIWRPEVPYQSVPENALKCAAQKGKCQCPPNGLVYYGAKNEDGMLDTSQNFTSRESFHHGWTPCKDSYFGDDTLPGVKKYCFCDHLVADGGKPKHEECSKEGGKCECELGGEVVFGTPNVGKPGFEFLADHIDKDADISGTTECDKDYFGSRPDKISNFRNLACFCEAPVS